jgi:hypothetical protein
MHILSTGCQWRAIPKELPSRSTLYDYIHQALYCPLRSKQVVLALAVEKRGLALFLGIQHKYQGKAAAHPRRYTRSLDARPRGCRR